LAIGLHTVTWTASDASGRSGTDTQLVEVQDTTPPAIACPADITAVCTRASAALVTPGIARGSDLCGSVSLTSHARASFPMGTSSLRYTATDDARLTASCTSLITVKDTTPPGITGLTATPSSLWPPDHKMQPVRLHVTAADRCDPAAPACRITAIRSNEPVNGLGDGDTAPDWQITGSLTALLRAERSGTHTPGCAPNRSRPGRIYTLEVTCRDNAGNSALRTTTVSVPHDQRK
jgi:hypothetical protein